MAITHFHGGEKALVKLKELNSSYLILLSYHIEDTSPETFISTLQTIQNENSVIVYSQTHIPSTLSQKTYPKIKTLCIGDDCFQQIHDIINSDDKNELSSINHALETPKLITYMNKNTYTYHPSPFSDIINAYTNWKKTFFETCTKPSILIVEDEHLYLNFLHDILKSSYIVTAESCADQARKHITSNTYDLLIIDMFLGNSNGLELLKLCKQTNPLSEVIMITAFDLLEKKPESIQLGIFDYMQKPILKEDLLHATKQATKKFQTKRFEKNVIPYFFQKLSQAERFCLLDNFHKTHPIDIPSIQLLFPRLSTMQLSAHINNIQPNNLNTTLKPLLVEAEAQSQHV